jgi:H+/Cl- antiporter ClcA
MIGIYWIIGTILWVILGMIGMVIITLDIFGELKVRDIPEVIVVGIFTGAIGFIMCFFINKKNEDIILLRKRRKR